MEQKYSSKNTCVNTVNSIYTSSFITGGGTILDYGGGRYDSNKKYMESKGYSFLIYDKYNRSEEQNRIALEAARQHRPDYVVCSNVLNVIMEDEVIDEVLRDILRYAKEKVLFAIYEGDRSGIGKETTRGWQRNQKVAEYIAMIERHFNVLRRKGLIIECSVRQQD